MTIIVATHGRQVFGPLFRDLKIWHAWAGCQNWTICLWGHSGHKGVRAFCYGAIYQRQTRRISWLLCRNGSRGKSVL
jgi:hypothetical protein